MELLDVLLVVTGLVGIAPTADGRASTIKVCNVAETVVATALLRRCNRPLAVRRRDLGLA